MSQQSLLNVTSFFKKSWVLLPMLFVMACAKETSLAPITDPVTTSGGTSSTSGGTNVPSVYTDGKTVLLESIDRTQFASFWIKEALNSPKNVRITVNLSSNSGKYTGTVKFTMTDNGIESYRLFRADNMTVPSGNTSNGHGGKSFGEYNQFFNWQGKSVFHGFFEDSTGAFMLVIDQTLNTGDGSAGSQLNGEVWFKNFGRAYAGVTKGQIPCWFIETGPYECRTLLDNASNPTVYTTSALYPSQSLIGMGFYPDYQNTERERGWRKLARFTGLSRSAAFGN